MTKILFLLITLVFCAAYPAAAMSNFGVATDQTYTLTATGAQVSRLVTITNLTDLQFPKHLTLFLYSDHLDKMTITDLSNKPVSFNLTAFASNSKIDVTLPTAVVGKDQSQTYRLSFDHPNVRPNPNVPQYIIEKPMLSQETTTVTTTVIIPKTVCPTPSVFPSTLIPTVEDNFVSLRYTHHEHPGAVTILCQPKRYADYVLNYHLTNPSVTPIETQIALPPDTSTQRLLFTRLDPQPLRLIPDPDGNRIATYKLEPKQSLDITVEISAEITAVAQPFIGALSNPSLFTNHTTYWPSHQPELKQQAKQLASPASIYNYIVGTGSYNPDQFGNSPQRKGGLQILHHPRDLSAQDFTDAFISLCRAAGIPSRRLIAYTGNSNLKSVPRYQPEQNLHVYPEWYDASQQIWIPVDPFWQTTNPQHDYWPVIDQLRLVMVINGVDDSHPYPGNVSSVTEHSSFTFPSPQLSATLRQSFFNFLIPTTNQLVITNHSNFSLYQEAFSYSTANGQTESFTLPRLDVNSSSIIPIKTAVPDSFMLQTRYGSINVTQNHSTVSPAVAFTGILVAIAGFIAVITGRLLVYRQKR